MLKDVLLVYIVSDKNRHMEISLQLNTVLISFKNLMSSDTKPWLIKGADSAEGRVLILGGPNISVHVLV